MSLKIKYFQTPHNLKTGILVSTVIMLLASYLGFTLEALLSEIFQTNAASITFYNFYSQDTLWCLFTAATVVVCVFLQNVIQVDVSNKIKNVLQAKSLPWILAVVTGIFICLGAIFLHGYTYSLDEYLVEWQAAISLNGDLVAHLPQEFQPYRQALQPLFIFNFDGTDAWTSGYRPVFSWLWAIFELINIGMLTNAILAAACIPLIHRIAKNIWPDKPWLWGLAAVLLATSPHFIFPAMPSFAWPAILFFNLLWLLFFIQKDKRYQLMAMVVGFLAVGLHQIHAHLLFAAPFVLWALFSKNYRLFIYACITYLFAIMFWLHWHELIRIFVLGASIDDVGFFLNSRYLRGYFHMRNIPTGAYQFSTFMSSAYIFTNFMRLLAWLGIPLLVLFVASLFMRDKKPVLINLCLFSILLAFITHSILMPDGMHGWGYRYMQGTMGSIVILAVFAFDRCLSGADFYSVKSKKVLHYLSCLLIASLLVSLPMRSIQMKKYVQPMKDAYSFLVRQNVEIVLLDDKRVFFGLDLIRNDPYLRNKPVIMSLSKLSEDEIKHLCRRYKASIISYEDLADFGVMHTVPPTGFSTGRKEKNMDLQKVKQWGCILGGVNE